MALRKKVKPKKSKASVASRPGEGLGKIKLIGWISLGLIWVVLGWVLFTRLQRHKQNNEVFNVRYILGFNGEGKTCGPFKGWGIVPLGKDKLVIADHENNRLLFFDRRGAFLESLGKKGTGPDEFQEPSGMTLDGQGHFYVIDAWNSAIKGFDENGRMVRNINLAAFDAYFGPRGIAWDGNHFLVADTGNKRVVLVSLDGQVMGIWGNKGSKPLNLVSPTGIFTDAKNDYLVADTDNDRLLWLDGQGGVQRTINCSGRVTAVTMDREGRFYLSTDADGGSVKAYNQQGAFLGDLRDETGKQVMNAMGMAVDPDDVLMLTAGRGVYLYQLPPQS